MIIFSRHRKNGETQHLFMKIRKCRKQITCEWNFLNLINSIYEKLTVKIILAGERVDCFPLSSDSRPGCLHLQPLFNIVQPWLLGVQKYNIQIGKKEVKTICLQLTWIYIWKILWNVKKLLKLRSAVLWDTR